MLKITEGDLIRQGVTKNLLSAHKRIAENGNADDVIRLSEYLFRLAKKRDNVLVDLVPENQERRSDKPVQELEQL